MGCFSYICKGCNTAVNAEERCVIFFMRDGKIIEAQRGHYDNYGSCNPENKWDEKDVNHSGEYWECGEWEDLISEHFNEKSDTGFVIYHEACYKGQKPRNVSRDDPNQGWGPSRGKFNTKVDTPLCKFCHMPSKNKYCSKKCEHEHILWGI